MQGIAEDKNGNIWFGTFGGGILTHDGQSFTQFTGKDAVYSLLVSSMLIDKVEIYGPVLFLEELQNLIDKIFYIFTQGKALIRVGLIVFLMIKAGTLDRYRFRRCIEIRWQNFYPFFYQGRFESWYCLLYS